MNFNVAPKFQRCFEFSTLLANLLATLKIRSRFLISLFISLLFFISPLLPFSTFWIDQINQNETSTYLHQSTPFFPSRTIFSCFLFHFHIGLRFFLFFSLMLIIVVFNFHVFLTSVFSSWFNRSNSFTDCFFFFEFQVFRYEKVFFYHNYNSFKTWILNNLFIFFAYKTWYFFLMTYVTFVFYNHVADSKLHSFHLIKSHFFSPRSFNADIKNKIANAFSSWSHWVLFFLLFYMFAYCCVWKLVK